MKSQVWVIILNWNGPEDTIECVESCLKIQYPSYQVVIVDNQSSDNSVEMFKKHLPQVPLIVSPENLGYAGGNNLGIQHALRAGAEYVLILNNDVVVEPNVIEVLVRAMETNPKATIAAPKVLYYDERNVINSMGTSMDWFRLRPYLGECHQVDRGQYADIVRKDILVGCALMIRLSALSKIGLLDEKFFLLHEEADWCLRNLRLGFENIVVPATAVYHKGSKTMRHYSEMTQYYSVRNVLYLCCKNANWFNQIKAAIGFFLLTLKNLFILIFGKPEDVKLARVFFRASCDFFRGAMGKCPYSY